MRKLLFSAVFALCVLCGYAQQYVDVDREVIEIPYNYINNSSISLKNKLVTIFGVKYTVDIQNVRLSPNWFGVEIIAKNSQDGTWSTEDWSIEQSCANEDKTADIHGNTSSCKASLFQNYDFEVNSIVHLLTPEGHSNIEVEYIIRDNNGAKFTLVLVFPYNSGTITAIDSVQAAEQQPIEYYDLQGNRLLAPTSGIIIEKQGSRVSKKLYR